MSATRLSPLDASFLAVESPTAHNAPVWIDGACFGVYADADALPDADALAGAIHESVDELLALSS